MSEINMEILSKELIDQFKKAQSKRLSYFDDAFSKVKKGNKESVDALRAIEKAYIEEQKIEKLAFNELKQNVEAVEAELKNGLESYYESYNIENEEKKLLDSKEKGVQPKMMIYRKETHDANFKYDRILKEEKDTLRIKQDAYEDFEKQSKAKIQDLEKRCRLEVNKAKSKTLSTYDDLQKSLLNTNNRNEIKAINKQIQDIQKVGLKEEKQIKLNYQELIKNEKLNYEENKKQLLIDLSETEKDFNLRKLEIETEKKHINERYQIELDKYDFGSKRAINNLNQKMINKKNSLILSYKENKKNIVLDAKDKQKERIKYKESITNDFTKVIKSNYDAFNQTIKLGSNLIANQYVLEVDRYDEYLSNIFKGVSELIICLHKEYLDNVVLNEYETLKILLNAKYNYEALAKKPYEEFLNDLQKLYDEFKLQMEKDFERHTNEINNYCKEANNCIKNMLENIKESLRNDNTLSSFHEKLESLLNDNYNNILTYEKEAYEKEMNSFEYIDSQVKDYSDTKSSLNQENEDVKAKHDQTEAMIDDEVKSYYEQKENESKEIDKESDRLKEEIINNDLNKKQELENNYNTMKESIMNDKTNNCKQIESDYQTAISLLK